MKPHHSVNSLAEPLECRLEAQLRNLLKSLPGLEEVEVWRNPTGPDRGFDLMGSATLPRTKDQIQLFVQCQKQPRPSQFPSIGLTNRFRENGSRETDIPVLGAPHISPRIAELCKEHGWSWFDLAGNCRLVVPGALYIERAGLPPVHESPKPTANLTTTAAAQVLRALLVPENADVAWTQTALQQACEPGVSLGLVNKIVAHLREEAWLTPRDEGGFKVKDPLGLLHLWGDAYRFDRHRRLGFFSLLKEPDLQYQLGTLNNSPGKAAYAAFSAAEVDAPNVRQNKTWLYVNDAALDDLMKMTVAKRVESGENLVVLVPEDDGVFYERRYRQGWGLARTNPLQTWLDLRHLGGRGEEAAEAILESSLKPAWKGEDRHA